MTEPRALTDEERQDNFASHSWRNEEDTVACSRCGADVGDVAAIYPCGYSPTKEEVKLHEVDY